MGSPHEPAAGEHTAGIQPLRPHQQRPAASSRRGRTQQQGDRRAAPDVRIRTVTPSPGAGFKATNRLDKVFEVGIVLKGLDGLLEIAGGVLLLLIKPQYLNQLASTLPQHELSEDPHDFLSSSCPHTSS